MGMKYASSIGSLDDDSFEDKKEEPPVTGAAASQALPAFKVQ
jgi:hypothetical protein